MASSHSVQPKRQQIAIVVQDPLKRQQQGQQYVLSDPRHGTPPHANSQGDKKPRFQDKHALVKVEMEVAD